MIDHRGLRVAIALFGLPLIRTLRQVLLVLAEVVVAQLRASELG